MEFRHASADGGMDSGSVTCLSFCTDPLLDPYLISSSQSGAIAVWSLNERSLHASVPAAHAGPVSGQSPLS